MRALLIDLDGVLRAWNTENDALAEAASGIPSRAIHDAAFAPELLVPAITGQVRDEEWRAQAVSRLRRDHPGCRADLAIQMWSEGCGAVDEGVLQLVRLVRRHAKVVLVTNATSRLRVDLDRLGLTSEVDHIVNSAEVGWAKPQRAIFDAALEIAGVPAPEALFVDDSFRNVAAAAQLGLATHRFQHVASLNRALQHADFLAAVPFSFG